MAVASSIDRVQRATLALAGVALLAASAFLLWPRAVVPQKAAAMAPEQDTPPMQMRGQDVHDDDVVAHGDLDAALAKLVDEQDPVAAVAFLRAAVAKDPSLSGDCHELTHAIGYAAIA